MAREIFALPNVEPSSHTHSHPLFWQYFARYSREQEKALLNHYPQKPKDKFAPPGSSVVSDNAKDGWDDPPETAQKEEPPLKQGINDEPVDVVLKKYYQTPRSYACKPFSLDDEISGSITRINELAPEGKKVKLLQWSGDTSPFEKALAKTREAGATNINGGDSRFDNEYPSYSSVAPIGLKVGDERQIYSSNSNENTYTSLWTARFFGYRYLQTTVLNTESPMRVSPFNLYFHIFSGEKQASLNAVKENVEFAGSRISSQLPPVIMLPSPRASITRKSLKPAMAGTFTTAASCRPSALTMPGISASIWTPPCMFLGNFITRTACTWRWTPMPRMLLL